MARSTLVRLMLAALLVRLVVLALSYATPRSMALRSYSENDRFCTSLRQLVTRRPECVVLAEDEIGYDALGRSIARGRGYRLEQRWVIAAPGTPTAYGGFLYPAFVGAVYAATHDDTLALFLIQALLGSLAVAGVALAAFRLGGPRAALVAGVVAAVHPGLALDSAWVMSEALAVPLLLAAYLLWVRWQNAASSGLSPEDIAWMGKRPLWALLISPCPAMRCSGTRLRTMMWRLPRVARSALVARHSAVHRSVQSMRLAGSRNQDSMAFPFAVNCGASTSWDWPERPVSPLSRYGMTHQRSLGRLNFRQPSAPSMKG